jgi:anaerobic magnesium-protoporphyrin IX monomethyl ester cyclase
LNEQILLINPKVNPASQNRIINRVINTTLPTSLGVLAGYLMQTGWKSIRIFDEQLEDLDCQRLDQILLSMQEPRIVGFSVLTISSKRAHELARAIKQIDPKSLIVFGGIHPTVLPEETLKKGGVDVVVRGEGEITFEVLIRRVVEGRDYADVEGISYYRNGTVHHNPERPLIHPLDAIPPFPFHLFEKNKERYASFGCVSTSRGCPYNCIFCSSRSISGKQYRYFSVERITKEIQRLVRDYGQKTIWLMDDNIAANRRHFMALLDAIMAAGLNQGVSYHGSMRGDNVDATLIKKAKNCNFKMIAFGLETGSENLMKLIQKGESVAEVANGIRLTHESGIATATTIIFGLPTETRADRRMAVRLVKSLPLSSVRFNTLTPYPGTPVFEMVKSTDAIHIKKDWENFAVQYLWEGDDIPYVPESSDRYQLIFDTMYANLSFYLSPKGMLRMLKSSFAGGNVVRLEKAWYLSPIKVWGFYRVLLYLTKRFIYVAYKMLLSRLYHRFFRMKSTGPAPYESASKLPVHRP